MLHALVAMRPHPEITTHTGSDLHVAAGDSGDDDNLPVTSYLSVNGRLQERGSRAMLNSQMFCLRNIHMDGKENISGNPLRISILGPLNTEVVHHRRWRSFSRL